MSRRTLLLETCEDRILCSATPVVTLTAPATSKIGDTVTVKANFTNSGGTNPGYGPYVDLLIDKTGADSNDGLSFTNATYLGQAVTATVLTFNASNQATHPYAKDNLGNALVITAPAGYSAGDQLIVLQLPFGSFTPQQPTASIDINLSMSNLADANTALPIAARGGFQYGNDALNNPTTDPSIVQASYSNASITPTLFTIKKTYLGPEDETATGPNYLRQYQVDVDISSGQTISNLQISDLLPSNMQFFTDATHTVDVLVNGSTSASTATATPSGITPGGTLTRTIASVTGDNTTAADATLRFWFYVPRIDAASAPVISATTGNDTTAGNNASTSGTWTPIDIRDTPSVVTLNPAGAEHTLTNKSIATQKTVTTVSDAGVAGLSPGDVLEYTIQVQISDYFAFNNLVLTDVLSDGQHIDQSFGPTFTFAEHGTGLAAASLDDTNWTASQNYTGAVANGPVYTLDPAANDGRTTITFRISDEMVTRGADANLLGGGIPNGGTGAGALPNRPALPFGATTATVKFRVIVQDAYSDSTSDPQLSPRDIITNDVTASGDLLNVNNLTNNGNSESDVSSTRLAVQQPVLTKTVYAINGTLISGGGVQIIRPGDLVTYRLQYTIPTGDINDFRLTDFLPLPVFDTGTFDLTYSGAAPSATAPGANIVRRGPTDTFTSITGLSPVVTEPGGNAVEFAYGSYSNTGNTTLTADLLFTVVVDSQQFADGLYLTNQARATEGIARTGVVDTDAIVQFNLGEPDVAIYKGVVGKNATGTTLGGIVFNAPGTAAAFTGTIDTTAEVNAIDAANGTAVDAGDTVRFAIVARNIGRADAYDVSISDKILSGYTIPGTLAGLNMVVRRGDGTLLTAGTDYTTTYNSVSGQFSVALTDNYNAGAGSGGLNFGKTDAAGTASTDGSNVIVIMYDLTLAPSVNANAVETNTASLTNYSNVNGGTDFTATDLTASATVTTTPPAVVKQITTTETIDGRGNGQFGAVVGETATFTVTMTIPEGTMDLATLTDTLDSGLSLVAIDSIVSSSGVTYTGTPLAATVSNSGRTVAYNFGTITNNNSSNGTPETITITYRAVVLDVQSNQTGVNLGAQGASLAYRTTDYSPTVPAGSNRNLTLAVAAPTQKVAVVEPTINTTIAATVNGVGGAAPSGDAGDPVVYTITLKHPAAGSADAFDVDFTDTISNLVNVSGFTVNDTAGLVTAASFNLAGNVLSTVAGGFDFANTAGRVITITISGNYGNSVSAGLTVPNSATTKWTSIDGTPAARSAYDGTSLERTGADGVPAAGILNDYRNVATVSTYTDFSAVKSIVGTSEASTTGSNVTPGEIVRFRLVSRIGEGNTTDVRFLDNLPAGLTFLNDGSAKVAFVSDPSGITSTSLSGAGLSMAGDETTVAGIVPTYVLPDAAVSSSSSADVDTYVNGTPIYFKLGDLSVNDRDADQEFVVIEFNAIVSNSVSSSNNTAGASGSDAGDTNTNTFSTIRDTSVVFATSNTSPVTVVEPSVSIVKAITTTPADAGDTVRYTITLTNANTATTSKAFDLAVRDLLDNDIALVSVTDSLSRGSLVTSAVGGQTQLDYSISSLDVNETIVITVTGTLKSTSSAGESMANAATFTYSSLPGSGTPDGSGGNNTGSTAGSSGSDTGERTGAGAQNDYTGVSGTVNFTLATPTVDKLDLNATTYSVGDQVIYFLNVTLPEGVTENLSISDLLPPGLTPLSYDIILSGAATGTTATPSANFNGTGLTAGHTDVSGGADGQDIVLSLGSITTAADNIASNNNFLIRVVAQVSDSAAAVTGSTLANVGQLSYRVPNASAATDPAAGTTTTVSDTSNITVTEPRLRIVKSVNDATPEIGQTLTYTLTITHRGSSNATAYDLILRDAIPAGLTLLTGSISSTATIASNASTASQLNLNFDQLAVGSSITITYQATVSQSQATVGQVLDNNAKLHWDSQAADDANAVLTGSADGTPDRDYGPTAGYTEAPTPSPDDPAQDTQEVIVNAHAISGVVYNDANRDGAFSAGETGINGVTVTLSGTDLNGNSVSATQITAGGGLYSFANLPAGSYVLTETQPAGYVDALETAGTNYGGNVQSTLGVNTITNLSIANDGAATGASYNFGETLNSSLAGSVYIDANNDGVFQAGEAGQANVPISLTGTDVYGQAVTLSTTTDGSGNYSFTGLRPGTYTITETQPAALFDGKETAGTGTTTAGTINNSVDSNTIAGIVLRGGEAGIGNLFGELQPASLSGATYIDSNNNNVIDAGEAPISGVTVKITGTDDRGQAVSLTQITDASGLYSFTGLRPGTYTVTETQPSGYLDGKNAAGSSGGTTVNTPPSDVISAVNIFSNASATGYNFGELRAASISGTVFRDDDNSGAKNGAEPGLAGVTVTLTGTDDVGVTVNLTTTTGALGDYTFGNLRPGTYTVTEAQPGSYLDGKDASGTAGGTLANDTVSGIVLGENTTATGYTFGELAASSITGRAYVDANNNGLLDAGETRLLNVSLTLTGTDDRGNSINTTVQTNSSGDYVFGNLRPGTYTLTEAQPAGYLDGQNTVGSGTGATTNNPPSDVISSIVVASNSAYANYDFGELRPANISGTVFRDDNNDGLKNGVEPGIAGVTVTLTGTDDLGNAISTTLTTLASGTYNFANLRPGTYTITETQPGAYLDGRDALGSTSGTLSNDQTSNIVLSEGTSGTGYTFGELSASSIAGRAYVDANNDGVLDVGETLLQNVSLTLTGTDDLGAAVTLTTTTSATGDYSFGNLRPGTYTVTETQPLGYLDGRNTAGSLGGSTSNNPPSDVIAAISLPSNTAATGYNFGELRAATLAGTVFADTNNDGVQNGAETGIANVSVTITGTNDLGAAINLMVQTDGTGAYSFGNLRPGTYTITETQAAGYLDGRDTLGSTGGTLGNDQVTAITIPEGASGAGYNFGELLPASLSGKVYRDLDNDGVVGAGESGVANVSVVLTGTDDRGVAVSLTMQTDINGDYSFANLRPGTYLITETQPAGLLDGRETAGGGVVTPGTVTNNADSNTITGLVISAGQNGTANNFGELPPSSLAGVVYRDDNLNGIADPLEVRLPGVSLTLTGTDDRGQSVSTSATTAADGTYSFANLRPGLYTITETQPGTYVDGLDTPGTAGGTAANPPGDAISGIDLSSNTNGAAYNFGEVAPATLTGSVYNDRNNNGLREAAESGLSGVQVRLTGTDAFGNAVDVTRATDVDGNYTFAGLAPSNGAGYTVTEVAQPTGYLDGRETAGSTGGVVINNSDSQTITGVVLGQGVTSSNNNFGELDPSSLGGTVYRDLNNDGILAGVGETPIAGVNVTLTGVDDRGQSINTTVTTGAGGTYLFSNLRPSDSAGYTITEAQPAGLLDGRNTVGTQGGTTVNNPLSDVIVTVPVTPGTNGSANNFGELPPASLTGAVYRDDNNDGTQQAGESALPNVAIQLTGTDDLGNAVSLNTMTDALGLYRFDDLRPGTYSVTEAQPAGYLDGKNTVGNAGGSTINNPPSDVIFGVTLVSGQAATGYTFGELASSSLSGVIYADADNDGVLDLGETRLGGVTVNVAGTDDLGNAVNLSVISAFDGAYSFNNLRPGSYTLTETQPAGYLDGRNTVGSLGGTTTNNPLSDVISAITLPSNSAGANYNFGELSPSSLSGQVYLDLNSNGLRDAGESPVPNVTITLTGVDDLGAAVSLSQTTALDGSYSFANLRPSAAGYTITETQPANYLDGTDKIGSQGGSAGNDTLTTAAIVAGTNGTGNDFRERLSTQLIKGLVGTSESATSGVSVAVGEVLRYRLTATVPFGTLSDFQLQELLPPGLVFLNDGTAAVALVSSNGSSLTSSLVAGAGATSVGSPSALLGDSSISASAVGNIDAYASGTDVYFKLGTLTNTDTDASSLETVVIEFNARVVNEPANQSGSALSNQFAVRFDFTGDGVADDQPQAGTPPPVVVNVVEPSLQLTKGVSDSTPDIGQSLTYTLTIVHSGQSTQDAFDLILRDAMPLGMTLDPASIQVLGATIDSNTSTASALALQLNRLALNGTITITYQATVDNTLANVGGSFLNNARLYWDSLPGDEASNEVLDGGTDGTPDRDYGATPGYTEAGTPGVDDPAQDSEQVTANTNTISGVVYRDNDSNGSFSGGDTVLPGVTVTLSGTSATGLPVSFTTVTLGDGSYSFGNLPAGTYTLTETQPNGYIDGLETPGIGSTFGGQVSPVLGVDTITQVIIPAQSATGESNYNFGETLASSLSGNVYLDDDNDGVRDATESGIGGIPITLTGTDIYGQSVTLNGTTTAAGTYSFANLRPGTYTITESDSSIVPGTYLDGRDTAGSLGGVVAGLPNMKFDQIGSITLPQGTNATAYNFGELRPAALAGTVFVDADNDGTRDVSEAGIAGVKVTLTGTDDLGQSVNIDALTQADGTYSFVNLRPGTYTLTETQPSSYGDGSDAAGSLGGALANDSISNIGVQAGQTGVGYTFGERLNGLTGKVYVDANRNASSNPGEPGLGGVVVTLRDSTNAVITTTTTAADGSFAFTGLLAGDYTVDEMQPAGYGSSTPDSVAVSVPAGGAGAVEFGETLSSLSGVAYVDVDHSGTYNAGDTALGGVQVTLTGTADDNQSVTRTTTTAADGSYTFSGLLGGTYAVTETQPAGYADGAETAGTAGGSLVAPDSITQIALVSGSDATGYNFGENLNVAPGRGGISGVVYYDRNVSGTVEGGEFGIAGVKLTLRDNVGNVVATTLTGADGSYAFADLWPGTYSITETQPGAYGSSTANVIAGIPVLADNVSGGRNFGETSGSLAGSVYFDLNHNGQREAGEQGIAGVTVTLAGTDYNGASVTRTATTDSAGNYLYQELLGGTYQVSEAQPAGIADGLDAAGTAGGTLSNDTVSNIGLGGGVNATGYLFGENAASLTGTVYVDVDRNQVRAPGEAGLGGVTLTLKDGSGTIVATTLTAPDGTYSFAGIGPGSYSVSEAQPNGYGSSTVNTVAVTIPATGLADVDFGETVGSLAGRVYLDTDQSGVYTPGESGIGGVVVTLVGTDVNNNAVSLSTTTAADGSYIFNGLLAGNYTVRENQPSGYADGQDSLGSIGGTNSSNDEFSGIGLGAAVQATGYNFGETLNAPPGKGIVTGTVYIDRNGSQTLDGGEAGVGGVTLQLQDSNGVILDTVQTGSDGSFVFNNVDPGTRYKIVETQPSGYGSSTPDTISGITVVDGQATTNRNFGETLASLGGRVYLDRDLSNTLSAGDTGIPGVTVTLTGTDVNGLNVSRSALSAADGSYQFSDLVAGTYTIVETQPAAYLDAAETPGNAGGVSLVNDQMNGIALAAGADGAGYQFGERGAQIGGTVYVDGNRNGVREIGETPIGGVSLQLLDPQGQVVATIVTQPDGTYLFANLPLGDYTVVETQPPAYGSSTPNTVPVTLASASASVDFGETLGSLTGTVYHDRNYNGTLDAGEPVLSNVTVVLTGTDVNGGQVNMSTTTDNFGVYSFGDLPAGTYTLTETQPPVYVDGVNTPGTAGGNTTVTNVISAIGMGAGQTATGYLFGERTQTDLVVTKDDGVRAVRPGQHITYTMTLRNSGLQEANGVIVSDQFPSDLLGFVSASNGGVYDPVTKTITWQLGQVTGNDQELITLTVEATVKKVIPAGRERLLNKISAQDDGTAGPDLNPLDNTARDIDRITAAPDLYVHKTDNLTAATVGQQTIYVITGGNAGQQTAGGVIVSDALPAGVRFVSASNGGKLINGQVVWNLGDLRPGQSFSLTVTVVVEVPAAASTLTNTVTIADRYASFEDPTPADNSATDLTSVPALPEEYPDYAYDLFNNFATEPFMRGSADRLFAQDGYHNPTDNYRVAALPLAPIYSGEADPGATLVLVIYNANGDRIGEQTVMVDAGGNWMATFASAEVRDYPASVSIIELPAPYTATSTAGRNLRNYFAPVLNPGQFSFGGQDTTPLDPRADAPLLGTLNLGNPLDLGNVKYGAELLPTTGGPGGR